jgi:resolvase-like protein
MLLDEIGKRGAGDTTSAHGRLMLTVLGGLAEFERELIRARTGAGRKRISARKRRSALLRARRWLMWRGPITSMPRPLGDFSLGRGSVGVNPRIPFTACG